ncbi:MAG: hypothetical protein IT326_04170 [Anaerolineae bacterium]|nr:hypothetical protein [Anaerolineae bacterium]
MSKKADPALNEWGEGSLEADSRPAVPGQVRSGTPATFFDDFVAAHRRHVAQQPRPLSPGDVVDVFADDGSFIMRGAVVEKDRLGNVAVTTLEAAQSVISWTVAANCRYADALLPPANLAEWERRRGVARSTPPR